MKVKAKLIMWDNEEFIRQQDIRVKLDNDLRYITATIDNKAQRFVLPLHEIRLFNKTMYYEISKPLPLIGNPKVEDPKKYLVVSVSKHASHNGNES